VSTDDLTGALRPCSGRSILHKRWPIWKRWESLANDTAVTVFVHVGSKILGPPLELAARMEGDLISLKMREAVPMRAGPKAHPLHLTEDLSGFARERGHVQVRPDLVEMILRGYGARDGRDQTVGRGNLTLRKATGTRCLSG